MSNIMQIEGVSVQALVEKLGTPLMIYNEKALEDRLAEFKNSFVHPEFETQIIYASKAFSCEAMLKLVKKAGCGLDPVSGGELSLAKAVDFPFEEIVFHGNNKTPAELEYAITEGVGNIVVDNEMELEEVLRISKALKKKTSVIIRINPGISADTHKYIITASIDSKFGISIYQTETVLEMLKKIKQSEFVDFSGIHIHIGSQIFGIDPFIAGVQKIMQFVSLIEKEGYPVRILDLGGGFAATYVDTDAPLPISLVCNHILLECSNQKKALGLSLEKIMIEPGRSMVAEAGITVYTIGYSKKTANKKYIFVDGGMADNIRPALYGALYKCAVANKMDALPEETVTVSGKCCESGDILVEDVLLPKTEPGDLLAVYTTGAYGYSMASNYNRLGLPAVAFVKDGKARVVLKRQSYEDMRRLDTDTIVDL